MSHTHIFPATALICLSALSLSCTDDTVSGMADTDSSGGSGESGGTGQSESTDDDTDAGMVMCGDGVVEGDEECDDGNTDNTDNCLDTCVEASCGDGYVGPGEGCDDGNTEDRDGCSSMCALDSCGDGRIQAGEDCDDGNLDNTDDCLNTCVDPSCGDGHLWLGHESCDDGNSSNNDECLDICIAALCGDGFVWDGVEQCDDANNVDTDACLNSCEDAFCGDGVTYDGVEECDDGNGENNDSCLSGCTLNVCGDGWLGPDEGCDDGNDVDDDECDNDCVPMNCGDGILEGVELCDDGNDDNSDECLNTCALASCGDGFVWAGQEVCDDGNFDNDDSCPTSCELATCGDGFVWAGQESCDDGNSDNTDACLTSCEDAVCGDGFIWGGQENCDDGNDVNDDGCENDCTVTPDPCGGGATIYVDPDAGGAEDGSNWSDAYTSAYMAMQSANPGDNLWLAEGTYMSITSNAPTLTLKTCVDVYGGFSGTEDSLIDRPEPLLTSRISGDFLGNDGEESFEDNALHVIVASGVDTIRLDGLTISGGQAVGIGENAKGGGLYAQGSTIQVLNSRLEGNMATSNGGAVHSESSVLSFDEVEFIANNSTGGDGGAYYASNSSALSLSECSFNDNQAYGRGGAVCSANTDAVTLDGVDFVGNSADEGGGIWFSFGELVANDCLFLSNQANGSAVRAESLAVGEFYSTVFEGNTGGAALYLYQGSTLNTEDSLFQGNIGGAVLMSGGLSAAHSSHTRTNFVNNSRLVGGGAVYMIGKSNLDLRHVVLSGNSTPSDGGAIAVGGLGSGDRDIDLWDVQIINNSAGNRGGGVYIGGDTSLQANNVIIAGNTANTGGGGVYVLGGTASGKMSHMTLYNNSAPNGAVFFVGTGPGPLDIINSVFWGNGNSPYYGPGILNISYTCSEHFLSVGTGNVIQIPSPFVFGVNGEIFLNQVDQNQCVDGANDMEATSSFASWSQNWAEMTTAEDGTLDMPSADMGVHYIP